MVNSTCEVKYIAASDAAKEAMWLRKFIELGVAPSLDGPILLYCDSTGTIAQADQAHFVPLPSDPKDRGSR